MNRIDPCLWFDSQAEEAANFYVSVFKNSRILQITHYPQEVYRPKGSVLTVRFVLDGKEFLALNGGPHFTFTPAVSFIVNCATQAEIDYYWDTLLVGGKEVECGWLTDRFGLSWQIVPEIMFSLLNGADAEATQRAFAAMMTMKKLDIAVLEQAFKGGS